MTRGDFLKGMAAVPLARCLAQQQPQQRPRRSFPAPKRGDVIVVEGGARGNVTLCPWPETQFFTIASGPHPTAILSPDGRKLFVCFSPRPPDETGQPVLTVADFANDGPMLTRAYPEPLSPRGASLALSADGRWLYTLTGRVPPRQRYRRPEQGGTPMGLAVIYTFDTAASQFLPHAAETEDEFFGDMAIIGGDQPRRPWIGPHGAASPGWVSIGTDGSFVFGKHVPSAREDAHPEQPGAFAVVRLPGGRGDYYVKADGSVAEVTSDQTMRRPGEGIDGVPPGRSFGEAAVSGDGKLLFVPAGPLYRGEPYGWKHADRISTYAMPDLHKIREQVLQRPLRRIWADYDGSVLFSTETPGGQLIALDAYTLGQLGFLGAWRGGVEDVLVVP